MTINPRGDRAVYLQVADIVRDDITSGKLKPGVYLPSEASLGQTLGVGREAIRQGLAVVRAEGLIRTARGYGSQVREVPQRQPLKLKRGDVVIARMPSEPDRRARDLDEGVPLFILTHADGSVEIHDADSVELTP